MSDPPNASRKADEPLFFVHLDSGPPPLPGTAVRAAPVRASLEQLLSRLLAIAGCNIIPAPARSPDPPSIQTDFAALEAASTAFEVGPGVSLAPLFWTHAAPLRQGAVARALHAVAAGFPAQGFLALHATDVRSPLLFSAHGIPLRVLEMLEVPADVGGPFLVLVVCVLSEGGKAVAVKGFAQPVYHARRFVPVNSELERDVLKILEHLQVVLDAYGVEVDIIRPIQGFDAKVALSAAPVPLCLAVRDGVTAERRIEFSVGEFRPAADWTKNGRFHVDRDTLGSGAFVSWLDRQLAISREVGPLPS